MSFDSLMRSVCQVMRRSDGALDDAGKPVETWAVAVANHPCRWEREEGAGRDNMFSVEIGGKLVTADFIVFMREPAGVVINEEDYRIQFIERPGGRTLQTKILRVMVRGEYTIDHHLELICWIPSGRG